MKYFGRMILMFLIGGSLSEGFSQNIAISEDNSTADASAIFEIKSTDKGMLIPRTDTTTVNNYATTNTITLATGLLIYQTIDNLFYVYTGSKWEAVGAGDNLGNHTATENIQTSGNWVSNDGDDEGVFIGDDGKVGVGNAATSSGFEVFAGLDSSVVLGEAFIGHISGSANNWVWFGKSNFATENSYALAQNNSGRTFINAASSQQIQFRIDDAVKMRLNSSGQLGINVNPSVELDVNGDIEYTGTITDVSDERLKENFVPIKNPLSKLTQLQGYSYNMIGESVSKREFGFKAQKVQALFPELVSVVDPENGYFGVSYIQFIPLLQQATVDLKNEKDAEIKSLQEEVEALKLALKKANTSGENLAKDVEELKTMVNIMMNKKTISLNK